MIGNDKMKSYQTVAIGEFLILVMMTGFIVFFTIKNKRKQLEEVI